MAVVYKAPTWFLIRSTQLKKIMSKMSQESSLKKQRNPYGKLQMAWRISSILWLKQMRVNSVYSSNIKSQSRLKHLLVPLKLYLTSIPVRFYNWSKATSNSTILSGTSMNSAALCSRSLNNFHLVTTLWLTHLPRAPTMSKSRTISLLQRL